MLKFKSYAVFSSILIASLVLAIPGSLAAGTKPACKGETLRIYNKALIFYVPILLKLEIELQIKKLYDYKSDYTTKELYDVQQNDKAIEKYTANVNEYKPIVQSLAKSCKVSFSAVVREWRKKY